MLLNSQNDPEIIDFARVPKTDPYAALELRNTDDTQCTCAEMLPLDASFLANDTD